MPDASLLESTDSIAVTRIDGPPTASRLVPRMVELQAPDVHLLLDPNEAAQSVLDDADPEPDDGGMIGATGALDPGDAVSLEEAEAAAAGPSCRARCSLWWLTTPTYRGRATGLIGHYAAEDDEAADALLSAAFDRLRDAGCDVAVGPMDGNGWFMHRFATGGSDTPPFLLEPHQPPEYPDQFEDAGFEPIARYRSQRLADLDAVQSPSSSPSRLRVRDLNPERIADEVDRLYDLLLDVRAGALLHRPLTRTDFAPLYQDLLEVARPPLVRLAETPSGDLAGLALALPDRTGAATSDMQRIVLHDVAVRPDLDAPEVRRWLAADAVRAAAERGYDEAAIAPRPADDAPIFDNAQPLRRYALYAREL